MIVTCPECQTEYRLDPRALGPEGREVRCTTCRHTWRQRHVEKKDIGAVMAEAEAAPEPAAAVRPPEPPADPSFEEMLQQAVDAVDVAKAVVAGGDKDKPASAKKEPEKIPEVVKPLPVAIAAPAVYQPMGMGAFQFGFLSFLLCLFVALIGLFLFKGPVVRAFPPMTAFYTAMGFSVPAPGEGLRLAEMTAETRIGDQSRSFAVHARLSNVAPHEVAYPVLRVTLKNGYGAPLKEWTVPPANDAKPLAPGDAVPVKLEFSDVPEGGADAEVRVVEP